MLNERRDDREIYQLAEDMIRFPFRVARVGLRLVPSSARQHMVKALQEAFDAGQVTREHYRGIVRASLDELAASASAPPSPRRRVRIVRTYEPVSPENPPGQQL